MATKILVLFLLVLFVTSYTVTGLSSSRLGYYYVAEKGACYSEPAQELGKKAEWPHSWDITAACEQPEIECCSEICETYNENTHQCKLKDEYKDEAIESLVERTKMLDVQIKNLNEYNFQITATLGAILVLSICLNIYLIARKRKKKTKG